MLTILCWCDYQESSFSRRQDLFAFNLVYKEILSRVMAGIKEPMHVVKGD